VLENARSRRRPSRPSTGLLTGALVTALLLSQAGPAPTNTVDVAPVAASEPAEQGRAGSGLELGRMGQVDARVGRKHDGRVRVSVANIPNRTSKRKVRLSLADLTSDRQDFVLLNEVGSRDLAWLEQHAGPYRAYRDPVRDTTRGGSQSMNNVVMWRPKRWELLDAGRVKVVDDDRGYRAGEAFVWDRYVTWAVLGRTTSRAVVSVVSLHMPTNPVVYPEQPGKDKPSRKRRWKQGMARVVDVVQRLSKHGPVLLGGDMNSHPHQGKWTAAAAMGRIGHGYSRAEVMYLFHPPGSEVVEHRVVEVHSDHPAISTTVDLTGVGPRR
jgi:endonuclease/exonuclease/phosphatase family metal-dependent hydrolase